MSKFKFKLAPIVNWKSALVSQEERELEALRHESQVLTEQMQALDAERQNTEAALLSQPCTTGSSLSSFAKYRLACHAAGVALGAQIDALKLRIDAQTARVTSIRRDRELIERLKDRQSEVWRLDNDRKLDSEAGESFLVGWARERPARPRTLPSKPEATEETGSKRLASGRAAASR
jgi:flagellar export protein FliJ